MSDPAARHLLFALLLIPAGAFAFMMLAGIALGDCIPATATCFAAKRRELMTFEGLTLLSLALAILLHLARSRWTGWSLMAFAFGPTLVFIVLAPFGY